LNGQLLVNAIEMLVTNSTKYAQLKIHSSLLQIDKIAQLQAEGKRLMSKP